MTALAQVLEFPESPARGFCPTVLDTLERGQMIWARWPNGQRIGSAFFHPHDAAEIVARGWIIIDGIRAKTSWGAAEYGCRQTVQFLFEGRFREHP